MGILDRYDIIIRQTKSAVTKLVDKKIDTYMPVYELKNNIRILSASGPVANTFLTVHDLSDYKNKKSQIEIGAKYFAEIEKLYFKGVGECFTLHKEDLYESVCL